MLFTTTADSSHCHHYRLYLSALNVDLGDAPNTFHDHVNIHTEPFSRRQTKAHPRIMFTFSSRWVVLPILTFICDIDAIHGVFVTLSVSEFSYQTHLVLPRCNLIVLINKRTILLSMGVLYAISSCLTHSHLIAEQASILFWIQVELWTAKYCYLGLAINCIDPIRTAWHISASRLEFPEWTVVPPGQP